MKRITDKAADAVDLAIELMTLGEYGLEYPEPTASPSFSAARHKTRAAEKGDCSNRRRPASPPRSNTPSTRPARRPNTPAVPEHSPSPHSPADIIRTPRIVPDWARA